MALRTVGLAIAALAALAAAGPVLAQSEIAGGAGTTSAKAMPSFTAVTPAMLDGAAGDAKNWIHSNGSYAQTRYYPGNQINASNVAKLKPAFVVPDRRDGVDGDGADRVRTASCSSRRRTTTSTRSTR